MKQPPPVAPKLAEFVDEEILGGHELERSEQALAERLREMALQRLPAQAGLPGGRISPQERDVAQPDAAFVGVGKVGRAS